MLRLNPMYLYGQGHESRQRGVQFTSYFWWSIFWQCCCYETVNFDPKQIITPSLMLKRHITDCYQNVWKKVLRLVRSREKMFLCFHCGQRMYPDSAPIYSSSDHLLITSSDMWCRDSCHTKLSPHTYFTNNLYLFQMDASSSHVARHIWQPNWWCVNIVWCHSLPGSLHFTVQEHVHHRLEQELFGKCIYIVSVEVIYVIHEIKLINPGNRSLILYTENACKDNASSQA